ncbi:MAG: LysM peptidoglycan-binding domain-containing protein [Bacteroidales bacterium]|nr:LysM peptidoglycan-binding domain-containing protein [Bacteroidales bacterium]
MTVLHSIRRGIASAFVILAASLSVFAIDLPVTTVNGKDYYYYDVQPNETLFSLSQRLGMTREEIISYNPGVDAGLKAYTRLYFPVESGHSTISAGDYITATHEVKKGETLYGISKKYGISIDRLIALNPSARDGIKSGDVLTIFPQDDTAASPATPKATEQGGTHVIAKGETLYRIAVNNGITVEQLLAANPSLDAGNYTEGTVLNIPAAGSTVDTVDVDLRPVDNQAAETPHSGTGISDLRSNAEEVSVDDLAKATNPSARQPFEPDTECDDAVPLTAITPATNVNVNNATTGDDDDNAAAKADNAAPYNIAILLPFKLDSEKIEKDAENFTEFYRGFLIAANDLSKSGRHVNIHAYDTRGDIETVKELMARDEMSVMDMFIAPPNSSELDYVVEHVDSLRQFVFNTFAVRNNSYVTHANVIQAYIPHSLMYQRAIDAFMTEMDGRTPIFIQRIGATADKEEFTSMLKSQLSDKGVDFKEIIYSHSLKDEDFEPLDTAGRYVIIPLSSSANEFNKITPQALRFKDTLGGDDDLAIFGYPEWLTFRGERKENLFELNATIYSRFYYDDTYYPARRAVEAYRETYGHDINSAVPSQALMGYDVASFIINSMRKNGGDFHSDITPYDGLQSDFILSDDDSQGLVNTSVELIKFIKGGSIEHRNI